MQTCEKASSRHGGGATLNPARRALEAVRNPEIANRSRELSSTSSFSLLLFSEELTMMTTSNVQRRHATIHNEQLGQRLESRG